MQVTQLLWDATRAWRPAPNNADSTDAQLVLLFGDRPTLSDHALVIDALAALWRRYPCAAIVCCSGGGQISGVDIMDDTLVATAIQLDHGTVIAAATTHAP